MNTKNGNETTQLSDLVGARCIRERFNADTRRVERLYELPSGKHFLWTAVPQAASSALDEPAFADERFAVMTPMEVSAWYTAATLT